MSDQNPMHTLNHSLPPDAPPTCRSVVDYHALSINENSLNDDDDDVVHLPFHEGAMLPQSEGGVYGQIPSNNAHILLAGAYDAAPFEGLSSEHPTLASSIEELQSLNRQQYESSQQQALNYPIKHTVSLSAVPRSTQSSSFSTFSHENPKEGVIGASVLGISNNFTDDDARSNTSHTSFVSANANFSSIATNTANSERGGSSGACASNSVDVVSDGYKNRNGAPTIQIGVQPQEAVRRNVDIGDDGRVGGPGFSEAAPHFETRKRAVDYLAPLISDMQAVVGEGPLHVGRPATQQTCVDILRQLLPFHSCFRVPSSKVVTHREDYDYRGGGADIQFRAEKRRRTAVYFENEDPEEEEEVEEDKELTQVDESRPDAVSASSADSSIKASYSSSRAVLHQRLDHLGQQILAFRQRPLSDNDMALLIPWMGCFKKSIRLLQMDCERLQSTLQYILARERQTNTAAGRVNASSDASPLIRSQASDSVPCGIHTAANQQTGNLMPNDKNHPGTIRTAGSSILPSQHSGSQLLPGAPHLVERVRQVMGVVPPPHPPSSLCGRFGISGPVNDDHRPTDIHEDGIHESMGHHFTGAAAPSAHHSVSGFRTPLASTANFSGGPARAANSYDCIFVGDSGINHPNV